MSVAQPVSYQRLSKYPATSQDITLEANNDTHYIEVAQALEQQIANQNGDMQIAIAPLSVYKKDAIQRFSFRLTFQSHQSTLVTKDVNQVLSSIEETLAKQGFKRI